MDQLNERKAMNPLDYNLMQKVKIKNLRRDGKVIAILVSIQGTRYLVRYFHHDEVKEVYFLADELEKAS